MTVGEEREERREEKGGKGQWWWEKPRGKEKEMRRGKAWGVAGVRWCGEARRRKKRGRKEENKRGWGRGSKDCEMVPKTEVKLKKEKIDGDGEEKPRG